jgi:hypothetical protein
MANRFRILHSPILLGYDNAVKVVKATVTLHNFIIESCNNDQNYLDPQSLRREGKNGNITPGKWEAECKARSSFSHLRKQTGNRSGTDAARIQRDTLAHLMVDDKRCPWQFQYTFQTN